MAYTEINVLKSNGLFKTNAQAFTAITNGSMEFDVSDTKDPLALLIDIPSGVTGSYTLKFPQKSKSISLEAEKLNVVHFTSKNMMSDDGKIRFTLSTTNSSEISNLNIKTAVVSYTAVINH